MRMRMPAPAGKTETYDRARSGRGAVRRGRAGGVPRGTRGCGRGAWMGRGRAGGRAGV